MAFSKKRFIFVFLMLLSLASSLEAAEVFLFYSPHCHACHRVIEETIPRLQNIYGDKLKITLLNIEKEDNFRHFLAIERILGVKKDDFGAVPVMVIGKKVLIGRKQIKKSALYTIRKYIASSSSSQKKISPAKYNLTEYFLSFNLFTVLLAGAIDGINPCAFSCIIFFMAFLSFRGYRKREIFIIGCGFIIAVFLAYLAIGLGIFSFLYKLKVFHRLIKVFYLSTAGVAFVLGGISLYDWLQYGKKNTAQMVLQLPYRLKQTIHTLIHVFFGGSQEGRRNFVGLFIVSFLSGILVSLLEAVCTGQVYLPTITFILQNSTFRFRALMYLLGYNLMFILPLVGVFLFSLAGVSSSRFSEFSRRHLGLVKLLLAILFFFLGFILLREA
ncbi:MAG: hypothetical protein J7J25_00965 [Candidatus Omnitrophica bacterium]|nr:hypothetical protein [Candidatus Omnitrophota bacterium]